MSHDWFKSLFVANFEISKMFAETVTQSAARFPDVYFSAQGTGYVIDKICGNTPKMITDDDDQDLTTKKSGQR